MSVEANEQAGNRMMLTPRGLNRATLARQMLLNREHVPVGEAVRRVVALQSQEPASPYIALWNRLEAFDPAALDSAYRDGVVVRANQVRMTLHTTHVDDYRSFREASEPSLRGAKLYDRRFAESGLSPADADTLMPALLAFAAEPRTRTECEAWLDDRIGPEVHPRAWWGLRQYAPLLHLPTGGPWSFGRDRAVVAPPVCPDLGAADAGLRALALRYLAGFGPASVADLAQFALVQRARARAALAELGTAIVPVSGPNGETLFDLPGASLPTDDTPAPPRLLGMWDNILLAYADRSRVIPPDYRRHVIRANGDVLPTVLVDGYVAGVWRWLDGEIEIRSFHPLADDVWSALHDEAVSLGQLITPRDPAVYRRYHHWWTKGLSGITQKIDSTDSPGR